MKTISFISQTLIVAAALTLIGCSTPAPDTSTKPSEAGAVAASGAAGASGPVAIKRYSMHGKVLAVDAPKKTARIDGGPIGDWMGAMTMNFTAKDDSLANIKVGDEIDTTVFVQGDDFWIGEVKATSAK